MTCKYKTSSLCPSIHVTCVPGISFCSTVFFITIMNYWKDFIPSSKTTRLAINISSRAIFKQKLLTSDKLRRYFKK